MVSVIRAGQTASWFALVRLPALRRRKRRRTTPNHKSGKPPSFRGSGVFKTSKPRAPSRVCVCVRGGADRLLELEARGLEVPVQQRQHLRVQHPAPRSTPARPHPQQPPPPRILAHPHSARLSSNSLPPLRPPGPAGPLPPVSGRPGPGRAGPVGWGRTEGPRRRRRRRRRRPARAARRRPSPPLRPRPQSCALEARARARIRAPGIVVGQRRLAYGRHERERAKRPCARACKGPEQRQAPARGQQALLHLGGPFVGGLRPETRPHATQRLPWPVGAVRATRRAMARVGLPASV